MSQRPSSLQDAEACLRKLGNVLQQPVWSVGSDGLLRYGNWIWHSLTAIKEGDRFDERFVPLLHPDDRQHWTKCWRRAWECGESYEIERRIRSQADLDYVVQVERGDPVRDPNGRPLEWIIVATDTAAPDRLIAQLRVALAQKNEFLMLLAHEMRNPLAPINNALGLLARREDDPIIVNARALIARQIQQLGRLVEDLLELARREHGIIELRRNDVDLADVAAAAVETVQPLIAARRHRLTTKAARGTAIVKGDETRLTQVVTNLLINAAKYTDEGGTIGLAVERENDSIVARGARQRRRHRTGRCRVSSMCMSELKAVRAPAAGSGSDLRSRVSSSSCTAARSPHEVKVPGKAASSSYVCPLADAVAAAQSPWLAGRMARS